MSSINKKWFLPNDETMVPYGPFNTAEIITKIQEGVLKLDSYIWPEEGGHDWLHLFEIDEFKHRISIKPICKIPEVVKLSTKIESEGDYKVTNIFRRFPRVPFEKKIILHDQNRGYFASAIDISEKGIAIKLDKDLQFNPTDEMSITIRDLPGVESFSVRAIVLRHFKSGDQNAYGFYFLQINPNIQSLIASYVSKQVA